MYVCSATVPNIQSSGRTELRQDTQGEKVELGDGRQCDTCSPNAAAHRKAEGENTECENYCNLKLIVQSTIQIESLSG